MWSHASRARCLGSSASLVPMYEPTIYDGGAARSVLSLGPGHARSQPVGGRMQQTFLQQWEQPRHSRKNYDGMHGGVPVLLPRQEQWHEADHCYRFPSPPELMPDHLRLPTAAHARPPVGPLLQPELLSRQPPPLPQQQPWNEQSQSQRHVQRHMAEQRRQQQLQRPPPPSLIQAPQQGQHTGNAFAAPRSFRAQVQSLSRRTPMPTGGDTMHMPHASSHAHIVATRSRDPRRRRRVRAVTRGRARHKCRRRCSSCSVSSTPPSSAHTTQWRWSKPLG